MSKQHITLEQYYNETGIVYIVVETRNTITHKIGETLTEKQVHNLITERSEYTVKPPKTKSSQAGFTLGKDL